MGNSCPPRALADSQLRHRPLYHSRQATRHPKTVKAPPASKASKPFDCKAPSPLVSAPIAPLDIPQDQGTDDDTSSQESDSIPRRRQLTRSETDYQAPNARQTCTRLTHRPSFLDDGLFFESMTDDHLPPLSDRPQSTAILTAEASFKTHFGQFHRSPTYF